MGLLVVYFFVLKDSNIYKTPQEIIFERLKHYELLESEITQCKFSCLHLNSDEIKRVLSAAEINYGESDVRKKPFPVYKIYTHDKASPINFFRAEMRDSTFLLIDLGLTQAADTCRCR